MEIPPHDSPALQLMDMGYGGSADRAAVRDCMMFLHAAKKALALFYAHFQANSLSPGKYSVLMSLLGAPEETMTPSDLARQLGVSRPAITALTDALIKQKYVSRKADSDDRRKLTIRLTRRGRRFIVDYMPRQFQLMSSVMAPLSKAQSGHLRGLLGAVEQGMDNQSANAIRSPQHAAG